MSSHLRAASYPAPQGEIRVVPAPAKQTTEGSATYTLLAYWHLLSLDAATVAALWTWAAGYAAGVSVGSVTLVGMFTAVWMLYAVDRLLDALSETQKNSRRLELRHHFHLAHRRTFIFVLCCASVLLSYCVAHLQPSELRHDAWLGCLLCGYFLLIHLFPVVFGSDKDQRASIRLPKELAVGVFFAAAVFLPAATHASDKGPLVLCAVIFMLACMQNCLLLYRWEHSRPWPEAHATTRFALGRIQLLSWTTIIIAAIAAILLTRAHASRAALLVAFSAVAMGLLLRLHSRREQFRAVDRRALADACLLTPLVLLFASLVHAFGRLR